MKRIATLSLLALLACSGRSLGGEETSSSSSNGASTTESSTTSTPSTSGMGSEEGEDTADSTTEHEASSEDGTTFLPDAPDNPCGDDCNIWVPGDCGPGRKCMALGCEPGINYWDYNACRDLHGDGQAGEPCQRTDDNPVSGNDTCAEGLICWNVDADTGQGYCTPYCSGSPENPTCPSGYRCHVTSNGVIPLCLPSCNPLLSDCADNELCVVSTSGQGYDCVYDASKGAAPYGGPCEYVNACNPGLACVDAATVPEPSCANASGCCSPFCDLTEPNTCPGTGQVCTPVFDPQPMGYENVGLCVLPI